MLWFPNEARYWAVKLKTDINILPLMPDEDKIFGGSLVLDFRKWWRHVKTIYCFDKIFPKNTHESKMSQSCLHTKRSYWPMTALVVSQLPHHIHLLYGCVSHGLGTTEFTSLIGWNRYWKRSRFSNLRPASSPVTFCSEKVSNWN